MDPTEATRFNELYQRHLRLLKLQGKSDDSFKILVALFIPGRHPRK